MEMALLLTFGLFLTGFRGGKRILMIYITIMLLAALILSLSRGGWFGALIGLSFMAAALMANRHFDNKKLLMAIVGGILAVALIVLSTTPVVERIITLTEGDPEVNMYSRLVGWRGVVKMINDHPLVGSGPGTFATVSILSTSRPGLTSAASMPTTTTFTSSRRWGSLCPSSWSG